MLVHSGSGLHRHEYSLPASPSTTTTFSKRATLVRSAFSSPASRPLPVRYDSSIKPALKPMYPPSTTTELRRQVVSFVEDLKEEEDMRETMSEAGESIASLEGSEATFSGGRSRRKKAPKVSYAIAHPAPTLRQKQHLVHLRPQLLLQLQRVSSTTRPMPTLDVLPSAVFVPRLAKKFPTMFKGRGGLGPNDILCVKSEDYTTTTDRESGSGSDSDEEGWASRDVEAVICQARKGEARTAGHAEIVFSNGSKWHAVPISGSTFEFTSTDEHGLKTTARWFRRGQRSTTNMRSPSTPSKKDAKFKFSIIDPSTRRHPVIASLNASSLDIPDTYCLLAHAASSSTQDSFDTYVTAPQENKPQPQPEEEHQEPSTKIVSEDLRKLIQITGVWVALRQGWSPGFKYDDFSPCPTSKTPASHHNTPTSIASSSRGRAASMDQKTRRHGSHHSADFTGIRAETPESVHGSCSSGGGISGKIKRLSGHRSPPLGMGIDGLSEKRVVTPKRSTSTGTAFMARVAAKRSNLGNGPPSTVHSDSDGESLTQSPPRRAATTTNLLSTSSLSVNEAGKGKRISTPSPLSMTQPVDWDGAGDATRLASIGNSPTSPLAANAARAALSRSGSISAKNQGQAKKKHPHWSKFAALFKKKEKS